MSILATITKEVIFPDLWPNLESFGTGLILSKSCQTGDKKFYCIMCAREQYRNFVGKLDTWGKN